MDTQTRPIRFLAFATAWGSTHGGVNSFNRDFVSALAQVLSGQVACVVDEPTDEATKRDARSVGVLLIQCNFNKQQIDDELARAVLAKADLNQVEYWVGHDIVTGEFAAKVKEVSGRGRLVLIMHQSYQDYAEVKHSMRDQGRHARRQKELFTRADDVFAVGPLLHRISLDWSGKSKLIIPGLRIFDHHPSKHALRVAVFGRLTQDNALIKGIELAGHAVAYAVKKALEVRANSIAKHTLIKFIGADPSSAYAAKIKLAVEKCAGQPLNISFIPFLTIPELLKEIDGVNLSLMLSWHEGFGLAGWEAIGAGIPLILSKNTGVYELLNDAVGGRAVGCVKALHVAGSSNPSKPFRKQDLETASSAVLEMIGNIESAILDAADLRKLLHERGYTWESAALNFIEMLNQEASLSLSSGEQEASGPAREGERAAHVPHGRHKQTLPTGGDAKVSKEVVSENQYSVGEMVAAGGLTAFYPSREYYRVYRPASGIDEYVSTAQRSIVMVSINLMTGVPFDGLCDALKRKLQSNEFSVLISLLDPRKKWLMQSLAPALDTNPSGLSDSIFESLRKLWKVRQQLVATTRSRFSIRVHQAIPFGSAILLDHAGSEGRVQIETKVYKVGLRKSFAFEVGPSGASGLYNTLVSGYLNLIEDGQEVDISWLDSAGSV